MKIHVKGNRLHELILVFNKTADYTKRTCHSHYEAPVDHSRLVSPRVPPVPRLSCRDGSTEAAVGDDGVQEDGDQAGPGDGGGDDGVPAEGGAAHRAGHHGDPAGGVDPHGGQNRRRP